MRIVAKWASLLVLIVVHVLANTEKAIFLAPDAISFPSLGTSIQNLKLDVLTPEKTSIRKAIPVIFPTTELPNGLDSWYFLRGLTAGQRYEARVCWAATQPTVFSLDPFLPSDVFETPDLIQSLAAFSEQQQQPISASNSVREPTDTNESVLFLRIQSAADFFTANKTLMLDPPPVIVDIILDPFLLNVLPRSLLPTAGYLVVLAICGYFVSHRVWSVIFTQAIEEKKHKD